MSERRQIEPEHSVAASGAYRFKSRRYQTGVRTLVVLVGCCGIIFWASRLLWESRHPSIAAVRGLRGRSASERINAIRELERVGIGESAIAIPPLIAASREADAGVRIAAAYALKTLVAETATTGPTVDQVRGAIAAVIELLSDQRAAVRIGAVNTLPFLCASKSAAAETHTATVIAALATVLGDPDDDVRLGALRGICLCGRRVSIGPPAALIAAMEDDSARTRAAAVTTLGSFLCNLDPWIPSLLLKLEQDELEVKTACAQVLGREKPPAASAAAVPALVRALESRVPEARCYAAFALGHLHSDACAAIRPLIRNLREPQNPDQAKPGNAQPTTAIGPMFGDPFEGAAYALGEIAPGSRLADDAVMALTEVVRADQGSRRSSAVVALGNFGPGAATAIPELIRLVKETIRDQRSYAGPVAARALGKIAPGTGSDADVVATLVEALRSKSDYMRLEAVNALARFGPKAKSATAQLEALLNDPKAFIKEAAANALLVLEAAD